MATQREISKCPMCTGDLEKIPSNNKTAAQSNKFHCLGCNYTFEIVATGLDEPQRVIKQDAPQRATKNE